MSLKNLLEDSIEPPPPKRKGFIIRRLHSLAIYLVWVGMWFAIGVVLTLFIIYIVQDLTNNG